MEGGRTRDTVGEAVEAALLAAARLKRIVAALQPHAAGETARARASRLARNGG